MRKLKWSYDKKFKQWYIGESVPYANDGFTIEKNDYGDYSLCVRPVIFFVFKKLSSAKQVAQLIYNE